MERSRFYAEHVVQAIYISPNEERECTFNDVKASAIRFGVDLVNLWNWKKGDTLSLILFNSINTPALIWGCHWAGGTVVPSSPTSSAREYAFQLIDSRAKAIVTTESLLHTVVKAAWIARISRDRILVIDGCGIGDSYFSLRSDLRRSDLQHGVSDVMPKRIVKLDPALDYAFICYTSGTTGSPKGVGLTHTNVVANILQNRACDAEHLTWNGGTAKGRADRIMAFLPFYHIYGKIEQADYLTLGEANGCGKRSHCHPSPFYVRWTHRHCDAKIRSEELL